MQSYKGAKTSESLRLCACVSTDLRDFAALSEAGLVESRREGRETRYRLTPVGEEWDDRLDGLRRHLQRRRR